MKILVVLSKVNDNVTSILEQDAIRYLSEMPGISYDVIYVPGAFEIPGAISMAIQSKKSYDGYLAFGCVIRGSTSHYEIISKEVARMISKMIVKYCIPIGYGVINAENMEQALARVGSTSRNNYAKSAVVAVIEMIKIKKRMFENG